MKKNHSPELAWGEKCATSSQSFFQVYFLEQRWPLLLSAPIGSRNPGLYRLAPTPPLTSLEANLVLVVRTWILLEIRGLVL
jgi:hypothetical protein